ncbi:hypothetical protein N781_16280 [Pontibacillus halophilus JSM 076056 = DSM 19796]|uniref:Uncharacterized protein n=1 Tax=Pontibacillus halophilus JSM 076056 = DSM 19796 TaxID=1385510 RepID=A0A0A5I9H4_9BACI|nr:alpha/beta hydrolase [Pontibacillus halophilus]KGX92482.1 hypothetical protein N781_16280 [Pontibacillus halophilus JSM 076056 = DSM 19796]
MGVRFVDGRIIIDPVEGDFSIMSHSGEFVIDGSKIKVEEVPHKQGMLNKAKHCEQCALYRVEVTGAVPDTWIDLYGKEDEFFFAIQEDFMNLVELEQDSMKLFAEMEPKMELLAHRQEGKEQKTEVRRKHMEEMFRFKEREKEVLRTKQPQKKEPSQSFYISKHRVKKRSQHDDVGLFLLKEQDGELVKLPIEEMPPSPNRVAVLVHGLAGTLTTEDHLQLFQLLKNEFTVLGYEYYTIDDPIAISAKRFADQLKRATSSYDGEVMVYAHSMGGLVSRSARAQYGAPIHQLMMAGTPNDGSIWAGIPMLTRTLLMAAEFLHILDIKEKDLKDLTKRGALKGIKDLANESGFTNELNEVDPFTAHKPYFAFVGNYLNLSHDLIVHNNNMASINGIRMPHVQSGWNHFNYLEREEAAHFLKQAMNYFTQS